MSSVRLSSSGHSSRTSWGLYFWGWWRLGVNFVFLKRGMRFYSWWRSWYSCKIPTKPVKLDFSSHKASVIDNQPIWPGIHSLVPFFYVLRSVWPCRLLLHFQHQAMVVDDFLHRLCFPCMDIRGWRERLCEFSRLPAISTAKSPVLRLLLFQKVLLI